MSRACRASRPKGFLVELHLLVGHATEKHRSHVTVAHRQCRRHPLRGRLVIPQSERQTATDTRRAGKPCGNEQQQNVKREGATGVCHGQEWVNVDLVTSELAAHTSTKYAGMELRAGSHIRYNNREGKIQNIMTE